MNLAILGDEFVAQIGQIYNELIEMNINPLMRVSNAMMQHHTLFFCPEQHECKCDADFKQQLILTVFAQFCHRKYKDKAEPFFSEQHTAAFHF